MANRFDDTFKQIAKQEPQIEALDTPALPVPRVKPTLPEADRLGMALGTAASSNPVEAARKRTLGEQLSVAPDLVGDADELEAFKKKYPASDIADNHPAIARYLVRRDNAALVGRNVDKLKDDDSLLRQMVGDPLNAFFHKGSLNMVQQFVGIVDLIPGINAGKALQDSGVDLKGLKQGAEEMMSPTQRRVNEGYAETKGFGEALTYLAWNPSVAGYAALESVPAMISSGLIGLGLRTATGAKMGAVTAGAIGEGLSIAGSTIEQIRQETPGGVVDNVQRAIALGTGVAGGAISRLGAGIAKKAGVADVETMIASGSMKQVLETAQVPKSLITRILGGAAVEGGTELPQSVIEQVAQNVATGKQWDEGVDQAAALGLVSGGITGGVVQTISRPQGRDEIIAKALTGGIRKNAQAVQANEHRTVIEQLGKQAAANPLRQTSPEAYREFIDEATQDSEVSDVYVNHEDLTNALAQSGLSEDELTKNIPGLAEEIKAARAANGDVQIPLADYLTYVAGTKVEPLLLDALRTTESGLSATEANAYFQNQKKEFEESVNGLVEEGLAREEFDADAKVVHDTILESLTKANRFTPAANKVYTQPFAQFYAVNAARLGITPSELYRRLPLKFNNLQQTGFTQPIQEGAPAAKPEDFSREEITTIHEKDNWMMITAYNPKGIQDVSLEDNEAANARLEQDLKAAGIEYEKVQGRYDGMANEEPSFLVTGVTHQQMLDYVRKYDQDSVLMRNGFLYQDGAIKPRTSTRVFNDVSEGNAGGGYTRIPSTGAVFTFEFDWSRDDRYTPAEGFYQQRVLQADSLTLTGIHYSQVPRAALRGEFYGTGLPGRESDRLYMATDPRLRKRVDFYTDTGAGVTPETGLGAARHEVVLTNIYDASTNPRGFRAPMTPTGMNDFETQVLDAGFDGYFTQQGNQGRVVLLGDAAENVPTGGIYGQREGGILSGEAGANIPAREADGSLQGLPRKVGGFNAKHYQKAEEVTRAYMDKAGLPYNPPSTYAKVDEDRARRIAQAFDDMKHDPQNPEVKAAYDALVKETAAQYQAVIDSGLVVEFIDFEKTGDPYEGSPRAMTEDVVNNNHMWLFSTREGFGSSEFDPKDNPLLAETEFEISGQKALVNDLFRVVHDYFGHVKEGVGFRAAGEENAWRAHMSMFSPLASRALTTETRGQNSWVNFGPFAEHNKTASGADTYYADQKIGLLPEWVSTEGVGGDTPMIAEMRKYTEGGFDAELDYETIEQRPGTTEKQRELGRSAYADLAKWVVDRGQGTLLGAAIARDFQKQSAASLIGQPVQTTADLAALAQVLRDPRYETFRIFYVKDNAITHHESVTARLPAAVPVTSKLPGETQAQATKRYTDHVRTEVIRTEADGYFLLHNHPSGRSAPSNGDIQVTIAMAEAIPGFRGHVVINSNEYSHIDRDGNIKTVDIDPENTYGIDAAVPHDLLNTRINGPQALVGIGKQLNRRDDYFHLVGMSAGGVVNAIAEFPYTVFGRSDAKNIGALRNLARRVGATDLLGIADSGKFHKFQKAINEGLLTDVVDPETGASIYGAGNRNLFPDNRSRLGTVAEDVLNQSAFYSALEREIPGLRKVADKQGDIQPHQAIKWVEARQKEGKFKKDEVEAVGLIDWLSVIEGKVSVATIEQFVADNGVKIEETVLVEGGATGDVEDFAADEIRGTAEVIEYGEYETEFGDTFPDYDNPTRWSVRYQGAVYETNQDPEDTHNRDLLDLVGFNASDYLQEGTQYKAYKLQGGTDYKELLLTLPNAETPFVAPHFEGINDSIVAHTRIDTRYVELPPTEEEQRASAEYEAARNRILEIGDPLVEEKKVLGARYQTAVNEARKRLSDVDKLTEWMRNPPPDVQVIADRMTEVDAQIAELRKQLPVRPEFQKRRQKVLFVEEIQSDWAQKGREEGFRQELTPEETELRELNALSWRGGLTQDQEERITELLERGVGDSLQAKTRGVPVGPFVRDTKSWTALVAKRLLRYAVEGEYDRIAWTTGDQQNERYNLAKSITEIKAALTVDGYYVRAIRDDGRAILADYFTAETLPGAVGQGIAKQILEQATADSGDISIKGDDLTIGGDGMRGFYDNIVPSVFKDLSKKFGGTGKVEIIGDKPDTGEFSRQQSIEITPELRDRVMSGLPLFQGQRAGYNPDTFTISLLKGSDLSSVIHEGGHFYLEALAEMARMPEATEQIKADFQKTMEWFGLPEGTDWSNMTLEQRRPYHEQWAQSFERYALEGKAPTTALQPVFARFRAWMLGVYKSMKEFLAQNPLAGKLNDDVREIFDRMIAAEDKINEMQAARAYAPLFESAAQAGVSEKEFQEYLDTGAMATEKSIDDLSARSIRDMRWLSNAKTKAVRRLQREAKAKREVIAAQVTREVWQEPVNMARAFLKDGDMIDDNGERTKAEQQFKLDIVEVKSLFPERNLTALRGMTAADGIAPDLAAQLFGFDSGSALVEALLNAELPKDKISGVTDQRMLEEHGDLADPEAVERAAEVAIHNEARARFMATGLKMLERTGATTAQIVKAARVTAEAVLSDKRIRDIKPGKFTAAESKANREVMKKLPKNPKAAAAAQRAALLNNRLAKTALEINDEVEIGLRYLKKFTAEGTRKNLDVDYLDQIDDLLQGFDLRKGVTTSDLNRRQSLSDWIDEQQANGFEPAIDASTMDEIKRKHYKNMTLEEFRGVLDAIKQIEHLGRLKKKLLTAKDKRDLAERIAEATDSIRANANRTVKERGTESDVVSLTAKWVRSMFAAHRKFNSIIREMDGGKAGGVMWNLLSRTMNEAGDKETDMKQQAAEVVGKLFETLPTTETVPGNLYSKKTLVPGTDISMTQEQRVMFAMNWGNEGNRQRLLDGGITGRKALSEPQAMAILDTLTKAEWDFVQGTWDYIATYKDEIAALERKLTGVEPKWIEPASVATKFGTYKGGYFPAKYDSELSTRSESLEAVTNLRMAMKGAFRVAATRDGYTQARADQVIGRPLLLSYNAISQHLGEVIHRLSWQPWLVDANRLIKGLDSPIRDHYGAEILRELRDTVNDIAEGDLPAKNPTESAINRLRVGSTVVGMGWRFSTALLQPSGLAQSWARIGGKWTAMGVAQSLKNPNAASELVNSKSSMMKNRGLTMYREINEVMNTVRAGKAMSAYQSSFFTMIAKMQRMVDIPTWIGAHEKALHDLGYENAKDETERKEIEDKAVGMADQAVLDSQSGGQIKDLAKVQRGSPIHKLFTNFYSYFSATYNLNVEAVRRTNFKSPTEVGLLAVDLVLLNVVPVLFSVALKQMLKQECQPDDLECLAEKVGHEQLNFMFGQMILLREVGTAVEVATGGNGYGYQGPAGLRFFSDLYKLGVQVEQGEADMNLFKAANSVAGTLLHYPAGQINSTVDGIIAIEEGRVEGISILPALIAGAPKD